MTVISVLPTRPSPKLVHKICEALDDNYPYSRLGNKRNPLDEYLYIILSLRTHGKGTSSSYKAFKKRFKSWPEVEKAGKGEIEEAIRSGGLAAQKTERVVAAIQQIKRAFGKLSLRSLKSLPQDQVEQFLLQLPGVGLKSARCIMMYSLGFQILPVDTHVARISRRLGLVKDGSSRQLHDQLEQIIEPSLRFSFHIHCVQHGRAVCRGQFPRCSECCLSECCNYPDRRS